MAEVTGPISSLPNSTHEVPQGIKCDECSDRDAVVRIQGETDSFGSEMHDICQECLDAQKAYRRSEAGMAEEAEWRTGKCDWCSNHVEDLRDARDYEEGMCGRVYRVCGPCIKRVNDEAAAELAAYDDMHGNDDDSDDDDPQDDDCWNCGGDGVISSCFSEYACVDPDYGCDECTRRCDVRGGSANLDRKISGISA